MTCHDINSQGVPGEVIRSWVERYKENKGHIVQTIGVDVVNHRVIFRRISQGYEHPCALARETWGKRFRKVAS